MSRHPDLIVPIHDRRKHRRILTLKNFGVFVAVLVVAFIAISIRSEMRSVRPGDYGRLFRGEVPSPVEPKPMEVIREEPLGDQISSQTYADPTLVRPMARSQWLIAETASATATTPVVTAASVRRDGDLAIVGGNDGVAVVRTERRKPELSGGFGR